MDWEYVEEKTYSNLGKCLYGLFLFVPMLLALLAFIVTATFVCGIYGDEPPAILSYISSTLPFGMIYLPILAFIVFLKCLVLGFFLKSAIVYTISRVTQQRIKSKNYCHHLLKTLQTKRPNFIETVKIFHCFNLSCVFLWLALFFGSLLLGSIQGLVLFVFLTLFAIIFEACEATLGLMYSGREDTYISKPWKEFFNLFYISNTKEKNKKSFFVMHKIRKGEISNFKRNVLINSNS